MLLRIDKDKLYAALRTRNIALREASTAIGFNQDYLSSCASRETVNNVAVVALKNLYDIDYDEYSIKNEEESAREIEKKTVAELSPTELSNLIYKAVYSAVLNAWENSDE
jgi:hypothetical protein